MEKLDRPTKQIRYDRTTRDFALYLNDDLVGYAATYLEGERTLNALVYALLSRTTAPCALPAPTEEAVSPTNGLDQPTTLHLQRAFRPVRKRRTQRPLRSVQAVVPTASVVVEDDPLAGLDLHAVLRLAAVLEREEGLDAEAAYAAAIDTLRYEATLTPESPIALAEDLATLHPTAWGLLITTPQRTMALPWPLVRQLAAALPQLLRQVP